MFDSLKEKIEKERKSIAKQRVDFTKYLKTSDFIFNDHAHEQLRRIYERLVELHLMELGLKDIERSNECLEVTIFPEDCNKCTAISTCKMLDKLPEEWREKQ